MLRFVPIAFPPVPDIRVLRFRCSVSFPGWFFDSGGQSKSVSLVQTQSSTDFRIPASANCCTRSSTEVCRSAASVLIVTSVAVPSAAVYCATSPTSKCTGSHNQCSAFFSVSLRYQPDHRPVRRIFQRTNATGSQLNAKSIYPFKVQRIISRFLSEAFFLGLCNGGQYILARSRSASRSAHQGLRFPASFIGTMASSSSVEASTRTVASLHRCRDIW